MVSLTASAPPAPAIFAIVLYLAWSFFLLRAVRWLWIVTVVLGVLDLALSLVTGTAPWHHYLIGIGGLALLLLPATRGFFEVRKTTPAT